MPQLIHLIAAARPNFMKVAPVLLALEAREVECRLVHTGQHYDDAMSDVFFRELEEAGAAVGTHLDEFNKADETIDELGRPPDLEARRHLHDRAGILRLR